jgi:hypothetical protein
MMRDLTAAMTKWDQENGEHLSFLFWLAMALMAATLFSHVIPYVPQTLAVYLIVAIFWWLRTGWFPDRARRDVPGLASFPLVCASIIAALVLWFGCAALYDIYYPYSHLLDFPILVAGLGLVAAISLLFSLWLARLYWDTKIRLALLEEVVSESSGIDLNERRRKYFAESMWRERQPGFLLRQIAQEDLPCATAADSATV